MDLRSLEGGIRISEGAGSIHKVRSYNTEKHKYLKRMKFNKK